MPNKEDIAKSFAVKNGYDGITFDREWNGFIAFSAYKNDDDGLIIGYPTFILVSSTNEVRFANPKEIRSILGLKSMPEGFTQTFS